MMYPELDRIYYWLCSFFSWFPGKTGNDKGCDVFISWKIVDAAQDNAMLAKVKVRFTLWSTMVGVNKTRIGPGQIMDQIKERIMDQITEKKVLKKKIQKIKSFIRY